MPGRKIGLLKIEEQIEFHLRLDEIIKLEEKRNKLDDAIKTLKIKNAELYWKVNIGDLLKHKSTKNTVQITDYSVSLSMFICKEKLSNGTFGKEDVLRHIEDFKKVKE